jgi:hypothetical protein
LQQTNFDAVVGADFARPYMRLSLRGKLGLLTRASEVGNGVGRTWHWNRRPGARCDDGGPGQRLLRRGGASTKARFRI